MSHEYKQANSLDPSFHHRLKTLTAPFHAALESTVRMRALVAAEVSRSDYVDYLAQLYGVHLVIESRAAQWGQWVDYGIDIRQRTRLELLRLDLAALGMTDAVPPALQVWDERWGFAEAVGTMYVLEGSTMGGIFLSQRLSGIVGNDALPATRYLNGYGDQTMRLWGEFTHFLNRYANDVSAAERNRVLLAACSLFLSIEEMFR